MTPNIISTVAADETAGNRSINLRSVIGKRIPAGTSIAFCSRQRFTRGEAVECSAMNFLTERPVSLLITFPEYNAQRCKLKLPVAGKWNTNFLGLQKRALRVERCIISATQRCIYGARGLLITQIYRMARAININVPREHRLLSHRAARVLLPG